VRNPILPLGLSLLLLLAEVQPSQAASAQQATDQSQNAGKAAPAQTPATIATDTAKTLLPGQFILPEGTPVKLRLGRNMSSADAHEGDSVDFEVLEDVAANGMVVIPTGSVAIGTVTEARPKRRMGRAGKLEIVLDYVRLADTKKLQYETSRMQKVPAIQLLWPLVSSPQGCSPSLPHRSSCSCMVRT
jgi:hypothetical protein